MDADDDHQHHHSAVTGNHSAIYQAFFCHLAVFLPLVQCSATYRDGKERHAVHFDSPNAEPAIESDIQMTREYSPIIG